MASILFVDDEFEVLEGIRRNLRNRRDVWRMDFVTSAEHALAKLAAEEFDVVVSDVLMPNMQGDQFVYEVLDGGFGVSPIVLSGDPDPALREYFRTCAVPQIAKPCDAQVLIDTIETVLADRRAAAEDVPPRDADITGPHVFGGTVELEGYLILLARTMVEAGLLDAAALPPEVRARLRDANAARERVPTGSASDDDLIALASNDPGRGVPADAYPSGWVNQEG